MTDTGAMESCVDSTCPRTFIEEGTLQTHVQTVHPDLAREFTPKQRKAAAKKGQAQKDGSYPIKNAQDLKNAIKAYGRSKNKAATKRHIINRARKLGLTKSLPSGWVSDKAKESIVPYKIVPKGGKYCVMKEGGSQVACHDTKAGARKQQKALYANEKASLDVAAAVAFRIPCDDEACERAFVDFDTMARHADTLHAGEKTLERAEALLTFDDTRKIVHEFIREEFGRTGDYKANPVVPAIWTWIEDLASDWVVYTVEEGNDITLFKASYVITDGAVTLGDATEVRRRTVYEPVKKES